MPYCERSRAAGKRHADDAALRGRVGDLPDLAVEGGDRGGVSRTRRVRRPRAGSLAIIARRGIAEQR